jgi:hypothetical protein
MTAVGQARAQFGGSAWTFPAMIAAQLTTSLASSEGI